MGKLFSQEEVAVTLGVHLKTVQHWCRAGRIRAVRVGKWWRVPEGEVERITREGVPRPERGEA